MKLAKILAQQLCPTVLADTTTFSSHSSFFYSALQREVQITVWNNNFPASAKLLGTVLAFILGMLCTAPLNLDMREAPPWL